MNMLILFMDNRLESEKIVVQAPMSFSGSWQRLRNLCRDNIWAKLIIYPTFLPIVWFMIALWYLLFGNFSGSIDL